MTEPAKRKKASTDRSAIVDPDYAHVVKAFANERQVAQEQRQGFGSGALKVKGKIFALMSSQGQFVVKLPKPRVDELVSDRTGVRWDPGHGRIMQEWIAVRAGRANWVALAKEACAFVGGRAS
ncbi:MAG TPA: hypothetical protein VH158_09350 [Gemmatimonadales bacterium]|jgi:hypothetical protein|nr:hypothetical protein [Gemmatimonadales bacterium]